MTKNETNEKLPTVDKKDNISSRKNRKNKE